jgi:hypothetical protein
MNHETTHQPKQKQHSKYQEIVPVPRALKLLSMFQIQRKHQERLLKELLHSAETPLGKGDLTLKHLKNNISQIAIYKPLVALKELIAKLQLLLQSEINIIEGNLATIFLVDQTQLKRVLAGI